MLKVAVIGLGDISKIHLPVIQENPNVELVRFVISMNH